MTGDRKLIWWDRTLWWRTYRVGGRDGFRTLTGRFLSCSTMDTALRRPDLHADMRRASKLRPSRRRS